MARFNITYGIITPESSGEGDYAETGFIAQDLPFRDAIETFTGVAHWASYLVNGDASGLDESEQALADKWQESIAPYYVVSIEDDSERFTWHGELYGADCPGVTVCNYICHIAE